MASSTPSRGASPLVLSTITSPRANGAVKSSGLIDECDRLRGALAELRAENDTLRARATQFEELKMLADTLRDDNERLRARALAAEEKVHQLQIECHRGRSREWVESRLAMAGSSAARCDEVSNTPRADAAPLSVSGSVSNECAVGINSDQTVLLEEEQPTSRRSSLTDIVDPIESGSVDEVGSEEGGGSVEEASSDVAMLAHEVEPSPGLDGFDSCDQQAAGEEGNADGSGSDAVHASPPRPLDVEVTASEKVEASSEQAGTSKQQAGASYSQVQARAANDQVGASEDDSPLQVRTPWSSHHAPRRIVVSDDDDEDEDSVGDEGGRVPRGTRSRAKRGGLRLSSPSLSPPPVAPRTPRGDLLDAGAHWDFGGDGSPGDGSPGMEPIRRPRRGRRAAREPDTRSSDGSDAGSDLDDFIVPDDENEDEDDDDDGEWSGSDDASSDSALSSDYESGGGTPSSGEAVRAKPSGRAKPRQPAPSEASPAAPSVTEQLGLDIDLTAVAGDECTGGGARRGARGQRTPAGASWAATRRELVDLAPEIFAELNQIVFDGSLPPTTSIVWNAKLQRTAGQCVFETHSGVRVARIELSKKVLDCEERLRKTLAHEMCHAAQWVLDGASKPAHGAAFWRWAREVERKVPGTKVSTCHSYEIFYKFRYACDGCGHQFGRQSKSVDLARQRCGRCRGTLRLLGSFNRDGTPAKPREPSAFAKFVKENYSTVKGRRPGAHARPVLAHTCAPHTGPSHHASPAGRCLAQGAHGRHQRALAHSARRDKRGSAR